MDSRYPNEVFFLGLNFDQIYGDFDLEAFSNSLGDILHCTCTVNGRIYNPGAAKVTYF